MERSLARRCGVGARPDAMAVRSGPGLADRRERLGRVAGDGAGRSEMRPTIAPRRRGHEADPSTSEEAEELLGAGGSTKIV